MSVTAGFNVNKTAFPLTWTRVTVRVRLPPVTEKALAAGLEDEFSGSL